MIEQNKEVAVDENKNPSKNDDEPEQDTKKKRGRKVGAVKKVEEPVDEEPETVAMPPSRKSMGVRVLTRAQRAKLQTKN